MLVRWLAVAAIALAATLYSPLLPGQTPDPSQLVHQAMDQALLDSGNPFLRIIKQGSWISRDGYLNPLDGGTSDHDARLFISLEDVPEDKALDAWKKVRGRVEGRLRALAQKAGYTAEQTDMLLRSVNLYPPTQAMGGIADDAQALARFRTWQVGPNLGGAPAEGVFSRYTKFVRQGFEKGNRVSVSVLVVEEGQDALKLVHRSDASIEHLLEGLGQENLEGYVQAAEHSVEQAQEALRRGEADAVRKHLRRARKFNEGARRLGGVKAEGSLGQELDAIDGQLDDLVNLAFGETASSRELVRRTRALRLNGVAKKAQVELAALQGLSGRNLVRERTFFKGVLEGEGKWKALRDGLEEASESALQTQGTAAKINYSRWFMALFALWEAKELPEAVRKEGAAKATARFAANIAGLANVPFGFAQLFSNIYMWVGELAVDYVASYGYDAVVARQDCSDLIAGLYTVPGRETQVEDRTCEQIRDDRVLACRIYDQHGMRRRILGGAKLRSEWIPPQFSSLLACHAKVASRHYTDIESRHDASVEQALIAKCTPRLLENWVQSRQLVVNEIDAFRQSLAESPLRVELSPAALVGKGVVRASLIDGIRLDEVEQNIRSRAACLAGPNAKPTTWRSYVWTANGKQIAKSTLPVPVDISVDSPGVHEICVQLDGEWHVAGLPAVSLEDGLQGKYQRRGCATLAVDAPPPPKPPPAPQIPAETKPSGEPPPSAPGAVNFSATVPSNWEGGNTKDGLVLNRKPAKIKGPCGWDSSVTASLKASFRPLSSLGKSDTHSASACLARAGERFKARRQGDTPNDMAVGLFMGGGVEGVSPIAMGDYAGGMADHAIWIRRGTGSMFGYTASYMGANGRGCVVKEGVGVIDFSYNVSGGGCWDNSDRAYLVTQSAAAQQEAKAILASLRADADGRLTVAPYNGPKYDGSDLPKVTLSPPSLEKLRVGDTIKVTAEVHNAKPEDNPFTYNWGGTFDGKAEELKKSATITIRPQRPGKYELSVAVDGARFGLGSASLQYEVADYRVAIERVPAEDKSIAVGVKTGFRATLTVDGKPAAGNFVYRWQPHPEATFDRLDASVPTVNVSFAKPGRVKVWVQVLEMRDGRLATVAESEQLEVEVIKPQLELAFEPKDPFVGQEVKARLAVRPEVKEIDFRWLPMPDNARLLAQSRDGREVTFYLKDDRPVEVNVLARVPVTGEDLGEAKATVKAKKYDVVTTGPKAMGPKPLVWKEGVGLIEAEREIAVGQIVEFAADTQPAALSGPVKYQWRVNSGSCSLSNPIVREARVTASAAGACELSVAIRDRNDVELGTGKSSFSATITAEAIAAAHNKAKAVADAKAKVQAASEKARKGDIDGAIRDADEAAKLDPANPAAAETGRALRRDRDTIHQQLDKARQLIAENRYADAQRELIVASNLNNLYAPVQQVTRELGEKWNRYNAEVRDKVYEVRSANERRDFERALELAAAWRASTKLDSYANEQLAQQESWARSRKAEKDRQMGVLKAAGEKLRNYDYAGALKGFEEGFAGGQHLFSGQEAEVREATALRGEAFEKNKRLNELTPWVRKAAEDREYISVEMLNVALKQADEAIALQPNNAQLRQWREAIVARAAKTRADEERLAQGRRLRDAASQAERTYLSTESGLRAGQSAWSEPVEVQMQSLLSAAIRDYAESLKFIPDDAVEKQVRELQATLEGRRKYLENYRQAVAFLKEGEALAAQAVSEPDFERSLPLYDRAIDRYRRSLALYRPVNAEMLERQVFGLELGKHERMVRKYSADGQALEQAGRYVAALAAYDQAIASFHPTVPQLDRMGLVAHAQDLRNRINGAKYWRADGEAKQNAGQIAEAIASYRQSLALVPDAALEQHVRLLEGKLAEGSERKAAAAVLWNEGRTLQQAGRASEALAKYKESVRLWPDPANERYVQQLEAALAAQTAAAASAAATGAGAVNPVGLWRHSPEATWKITSAADGRYFAEESGLGNARGPAYWTPDGAFRIDYRTQDGAIDGYYEVRFSADGYSASGTVRELTGPRRTASTQWRRVMIDAPAGTFGAATPPAGTGGVVSPPASGFFTVDLSPFGGKKGTPRTVKGIEVDDGSWIRLKATHEKRLSLEIPLPPVAARAVAIVSNLDNAHHLKDGFVTTVLTVKTTGGDRTFEIKAGVHSSEWNRNETSGADHAFPIDKHIGDKRWLAVFELPAGTVVTGLHFEHRDVDKKLYHMGAAPGFCLRGITLLTGPGGAGTTAPPAVAGGKPTVIYENGNIAAVGNGPRRPTTFSIAEPHLVTLVQTYHWNSARGATPGTIALRDAAGRLWGPWQAQGVPGQGGVPNANWIARPNVTLPAGTYTVVDSDPATWSHNDQSQGAGFVRVEGLPAMSGGLALPSGR